MCSLAKKNEYVHNTTITGNYPDLNIRINNPWSKRKVLKTIIKYFELKKIKICTSKVCDTVKAVLIGKIIALDTYVRKEKWTSINAPYFPFFTN